MKEQLPVKEIDKFCKKWSIKELSLFGSILRDDFDEDSDVDFLVLFSQDAVWDLFDLEDMQEELRLIVGRKVELVTKRGIENSLNKSRKETILSTAKVIYEKAA